MTARGQVVLVLGGTRSGKSALAERIAAAAASDSEVTYVATGGPPDGSDSAWTARVAAHRAGRPADWTTVEAGPRSDLPGLLAATPGCVVVDSLGSWIAAFEGFDAPAGLLAASLAARAERGLPTVVVSEEVGLAVHATTEDGRRFTDALGELNQAVAAVAARVLLVVAGRGVDLREVDT